jgi:hypothetical protein
VNGSSFTQGYPLGSYWGRVITAYQDTDGNGILSAGEITVSDTNVFIGEVIPPFVGSIQPTLTLFNRLRTSAVFAMNYGVSLDNNTMRQRCVRGQARARSIRDEPLAEQAICAAAALFGISGPHIQDADYTKLRELSVSYDVPQRWLSPARLRQARITVAGQNLHTWTDYPGIDPDISSRGSNFSTVDYTQPASRRVWLLRVNTNF